MNNLIYPLDFINSIIKDTKKENLRKCSQIELMVFDVDGILTDGKLYYGEKGEIIKCFNALDGMGLKLLIENRVKVAIVSGRYSKIVSLRAEELGIENVIQNSKDKLKDVLIIINKLNSNLEKTGFMGDDVADLKIMERVKFSATAPNSHESIRKISNWVSKKTGGNGAVRECCDLIITSKKFYKTVLY